LVGELAIAAIEFADAAADPARIYSRARSRLRRATQDPAHYSAPLDIERHDAIADDDAEPTPARRAGIVREIAQRQRVTLRRAQQIVRRAVDRAMQGDLFAGSGGAV